MNILHKGANFGCDPGNHCLPMVPRTHSTMKEGPLDGSPVTCLVMLALRLVAPAAFEAIADVIGFTSQSLVVSDPAYDPCLSSFM